jgi:hypothetical protein
MNELIIGFIAGVFGVAYFVYGKKQAKFTPMVAGVLLCVYPYFLDSVLWLVVVGAARRAAAIVLEFYQGG